jgi:hypothetical protein
MAIGGVAGGLLGALTNAGKSAPLRRDEVLIRQPKMP